MVAFQKYYKCVLQTHFIHDMFICKQNIHVDIGILLQKYVCIKLFYLVHF